ncbi:DNA-binding transcriptional regulator, GntR family [Ferrithrix thermotolerans DSM 19514]|jgi:DNA-binding GntR family transcriptional regulator|uniref:DNA-binding transcriptional regulator, GntR family n=2 Tax=Ferrithrix TaxID=643949 RepID=A0A1M4S7G4_9ACTN|nr:DNA-binding transcriptional regulator, GntR family [Ferrithrix thermotolerans DSM 19514]
MSIVARNMHPDQIVELLRRAVRERVILPGQSLNQDELAQKFGVSRIPLREALRTLVGEGLVVMRPGVGAVITELRGKEIEELFELRLQLEPPLTVAAVDRMSASDFAELNTLLIKMSELASDDLDGWASQHYLFHRRLFELAGKRHALRLVTQVQNLVEPYSRVHVSLVGAAEHSKSEHATLLEAIRVGDKEQAESITRNSILDGLARLRSAQEASEDTDDPLALLLVDRSR